jgi:hypothetical protein
VKRLLGSVIFLIVAAFPISSFSQDQVSGSFVVKGKTTPFKYVYAYWNARFMDPAVQDLYVLLSDVPITKEQWPTSDERKSEMADLVRGDKIHALELHFDVPGKSLYAASQGAVCHKTISEGRTIETGMFIFQPTSVDGKTVDGKLSTDKDLVGMLGWNAQATFKVKVPPKK